MKNNDFQELVDRRLSGLEWDEGQRRGVLSAVREEEKPMKKKVSFAFVLAVVVLCAGAAAIAEGLLFSQRYSAARLANQAMEQQYGMTSDILSLFYRQVTQHSGGAATVTYSVGSEADFPAEQMGVYTVEVKGNQAKASWSNDGKDTSGGLKAEAFGAEQLRMLSYDYANTMKQLADAGLFQPKAAATPMPIAAATPMPIAYGEDGRIVWTDEDRAEANQALAEAERAEKERKDEITKAEAAGKLSIEKAAGVAKAAIVQEYALTEKQIEKLMYEPDSVYITWQEGKPQANLLFWLWQGEDETFREKDGQYWVTVNLETGVIEDILYDAVLAGNG